VAGGNWGSTSEIVKGSELTNDQEKGGKRYIVAICERKKNARPDNHQKAGKLGEPRRSKIDQESTGSEKGGTRGTRALASKKGAES